MAPKLPAHSRNNILIAATISTLDLQPSLGSLILYLGSLILYLGSLILSLESLILYLGSLILHLGSLILYLGTMTTGKVALAWLVVATCAEASGAINNTDRLDVSTLLREFQVAELFPGWWSSVLGNNRAVSNKAE